MLTLDISPRLIGAVALPNGSDLFWGATVQDGLTLNSSMQRAVIPTTEVRSSSSQEVQVDKIRNLRSGLASALLILQKHSAREPRGVPIPKISALIFLENSFSFPEPQQKNIFDKVAKIFLPNSKRALSGLWHLHLPCWSSLADRPASFGACHPPMHRPTRR